MRKYLAAFTAILLLVGTMFLFSSCDEKTVTYEYSMSDRPVCAEDETVVNVKDADVLELKLDLHTAGYLKLLAYDCTEYQEYPDDIVEIWADFLDENGKKLYEGIKISDGFIDKYRFDAGVITARITFKNATDEFKDASIAWAFAEDKPEPITLDLGVTGAAAVDKDGNAKFSFEIEQAGIYDVRCAEACIFEPDCDFAIYDAKDNELVVNGDIHGTEWISRYVFLPEGEYSITVSEVFAVVSCCIEIEKLYQNIVYDNDSDAALPVTFGFTPKNQGERTVAFTADSSKDRLVVEAIGASTYYDYAQEFDICITDSQGKVLVEETCDMGFGVYNMSQFYGECTIKINISGNCVVTMKLE